MDQKIVSRDDDIFDDVCELLEIDPEHIEYLIYEDFDDVDYMLYQDFDEYETTDTSWQPEHRIIEIFYTDNTQEEIEIEIGSELDEALKRIILG
jgi:hypothetical protein